LATSSHSSPSSSFPPNVFPQHICVQNKPTTPIGDSLINQ
jgi:hypothetical protein